ncbi:DinB family protein [Rubrivirga sp.]|uniref:DinB family protein n=1 Tax=Rubrivirga sp. TaxID=1885344 RepID=UPI003C71F415
MSPLFADFDLEAQATRQMLAAVPWEHADWKPHEKSMSLGALALHVASLPTMAVQTMTTDGLDLATPRPPRPEITSTDDLVAMWDEKTAEVRALLEDASEADLEADWSLAMGGKTLSTDPRHVVVRRWMLSHIAHHRGQLSVYLRLLDAFVPGTYGPSADDRRLPGE